MRKHIINQDFFQKLLSSQILVIDGGARGNIFFPFNKVKKDNLKIIRFEPDPNASITHSNNEITYNKGIWKENDSITLNIAKEPSASSVFENNLPLHKEFEDSLHKIPRKTVNKETIECESIDFIREKLQLNSIDFIKLDIHGAEYEALKGAEKSIPDCVGFVVETWTSPIHLHQKTHGKVESFLSDYNFYPFDVLKSFFHERKKKPNQKYFSKKQLCSLEYLYLKNIIDIEINKEKVLKTIAIADLYGQITYAIQLANLLGNNKLISKNEYNLIEQFLVKQNKKSFKYRMLDKLINKLKNYYEKY